MDICSNKVVETPSQFEKVEEGIAVLDKVGIHGVYSQTPINHVLINSVVIASSNGKKGKRTTKERSLGFGPEFGFPGPGASCFSELKVSIFTQITLITPVLHIHAVSMIYDRYV